MMYATMLSQLYAAINWEGRFVERLHNAGLSAILSFVTLTSRCFVAQDEMLLVSQTNTSTVATVLTDVMHFLRGQSLAHIISSQAVGLTRIYDAG